MLIYVEKDVIDYVYTKNIISKINNPEIIIIDNYKNIFDKNIKNRVLKSIIIAKLRWNSLTKAPKDYWHIKNSYFIKSSLNCIFDCSYCFLKWAFKNNFQVYFVNYDDIKNEIDRLLLNNLNNLTWFYSSDYSDILWMNKFSWFIEEFVPYFESKHNVMMEVRTKSSDISDILNLKIIPKNTEFAFSLSPQVLIDRYEKWTSSLSNRIDAINLLLESWYKVWIRFLPLLPVKDYKKIYDDFVDLINSRIDLKKINSIFASWLLFTKNDYNVMLKKYPTLDILYMLELEEDWFYRESREYRDYFYWLFKELDTRCIFCLDPKLS